MTVLRDIEYLRDQEETLESQIDDAADNDDGELWEDLNDELEDIQEEIYDWETGLTK